jgi:hypothetical protein
VLATLVTGVQTEEDERVIEEWGNKSAGNRALVEYLLDKKHYVENRALLERFPVEEAWEKIGPLVNVMVDPAGIVAVYEKNKNTRPVKSAGRRLNNQ